MKFSLGSAVFLGSLLLFAKAPGATAPTDDQLSSVRNRIGQLEQRLGQLSQESASVERERRELDAQLELADARVR
jgi:septal ring factor EnvC (AmiA/AmiB activator)